MLLVRSRFTRAYAPLLFPTLLVVAGCAEPVAPTVESIEITPQATGLLVGDSLTLSAVLKTASGEALSGRRVDWTSSDTGVATVSAGVVVGRAPGEAVIRAYADAREAQLRVTVERRVDTIRVDPRFLLLPTGRSVRLLASAPDPDLASALDRVYVELRDSLGEPVADGVARYEVSTAGVVELSDSGTIQALAPGEATIDIRAGGAATQLHVKVVRPYSLTVLPGLPDDTVSQAYGINRHGDVVGMSQGKVWVWKNGVYTRIFVPGPGESFSIHFVSGINDRGEVAAAGQPDYLGVVPTAVFLHVDGRTQRVGDQIALHRLFGPTNRGEVLATEQIGCGRGGCSATWSWLGNEGEFVRIEAGEPFAPIAFNDAGQIAARVNSSVPQAALVENGAVARRLPAPTVPTGLNPSGGVMGFDDVDQKRWDRAVDIWVWDATTKVPLQKLPGRFVVPDRANSSGQIIGNSWACCLGEQAPVLWSDGHLARINDLFTSDWKFERVTGINEAGQIVGSGRSSVTGVMSALLLSPQ